MYYLFELLLVVCVGGGEKKVKVDQDVVDVYTW